MKHIDSIIIIIVVALLVFWLLWWLKDWYTKYLKADLEFEIKYENLKVIIQEADVNQASYRYILILMKRLQKNIACNNEKMDVLFKEFWKKYQQISMAIHKAKFENTKVS
jgi:hypothetical protein